MSNYKQLQLLSRNNLRLNSVEFGFNGKLSPGLVEVKVLHCAICKTDAKMFFEGQRDLVLPRVLGHEFVVEHSGKSFCVYPGNACGTCEYCKASRENLCDDMKITGFHLDGGLSQYTYVDPKCLVKLSENIPPKLGVFAEPVGCAIHAFALLDPRTLRKNSSLLILGGGTLGACIAAYASTLSLQCTILENSEVKLKELQAIFADFQPAVNVLKTTDQSNFDLCITACADPIAYASAITKVRKGGIFCNFSGITKNKSLDSNLLNLLHYKEIQVVGSYGLNKRDMEEAVQIIGKQPALFTQLISSELALEDVESVMDAVYEGRGFRHVVSPNLSAKLKNHAGSEELKTIPNREPKEEETMIDNLINSVKPLANSELRASAQHKMDFKTKPLGSLGTLEGLAVQAACVQNSLEPELKRKTVMVFAGDHGIAEEGVSAFPAEVTAQMVQNFLSGGAAVNVLARHNDMDIHVVDMGVNADFEAHSDLHDLKIRRGTRNFALESAMTIEEAHSAMQKSADLFLKMNQQEKIDILCLGEMGIANTTSATAIISAITGVSIEDATGRGTGVDDEGLKHKTKVLKKALEFHMPNPDNAMDVLCKVGGYEIAGIVGAAIAAASKGCIVVLDGVISTAAGLLAYTMKPEVADYFVAGHKSVEVAQTSALDKMGIAPVLDLDMRLGEGTGAVLTTNLVEAACKIMCEMASFEEAGVSNKE